MYRLALGLAAPAWIVIGVAVQGARSSTDTASAHESAPAADVIELSITADDPLLDGHGHARRVERVIDFDGTLHVWAEAADMALVLRAEDTSGRVLARDALGVRGRAPYLSLTVEHDRRLVLVVAAADHDGVGAVRLSLAAAPEDDATRRVAEHVARELELLHPTSVESELAPARSRLADLVAELDRADPRGRSELVTRALSMCSNKAADLFAPALERACLASVLARVARARPAFHADIGELLYSLAIAESEAGDLAHAREHFDELVDLRSRSLVADDPKLLEALNGAAIVAARSGDLHAARASFERVLAGYERTVAEEDPRLQNARANLATALSALGDLRPACVIMEKVARALAATRPAGDADLLKAKHNLGIVHSQLGDLAEARDLQLEVVAALEHERPDDDPQLLNARLMLANTLRDLGELPRALAMLEGVVATRTRVLPDDDLDLQNARNDLAGMLYDIGELHRARALQERVLLAREHAFPADHPDLAVARANLAATLTALGDVQRARGLSEQALDSLSRTLPDDHSKLQQARDGLAVELLMVGDASGARTLQAKVLEVAESTLADDHPFVQNARSNLANTLLAMGEVAAADELYTKVVDVLSHTLPEDDPRRAGALDKLGTARRASGDLTSALELGTAAVAKLSEVLPRGDRGLIAARLNLAVTAAAAGDHPRARELALDAARELAVAMNAVPLDESPRAAAETAQRSEDMRDIVISMAAGLWAFERDPELERAAFTCVEASRAADLAGARLFAGSTSDAAVAAIRARARSASDELARNVRSGAARDAIVRATDERDAAQRALVVELRRTEGGRVNELPTPEALSARLSPNEVAVSFWRVTPSTLDRARKPMIQNGPQSMIAWVLLADGKLTAIDLGAIEDVERAVERWRMAQIDAGAGLRGVGVVEEKRGNPKEAGQALRRLIFDPLRPAIGEARRVVVALDDVLHAVPLSALPDETGLLGEHLEIQTRLALRDLLWSGSTAEASATLVAVGGVAFDARASVSMQASEVSTIEASDPAASKDAPADAGDFKHEFPALPGTALEAEGVAAQFALVFGDDGKAFVLEGARASRASLEELAPRARWLHVATHGWFAPDSVRSWTDVMPLDARAGIGTRMSAEQEVAGASPMVLCGLALAGADAPPDTIGRHDGLVTAEEIASWDLSRCELAVLSACDTNVGVRHAGQGVASLQKALHMAGARSVITSLWKVPDDATKDLMLDFYRRLWVEKQPKSRALWEAQMKIREAKDQSGTPKYTTRDWAAWVLTGDPH